MKNKTFKHTNRILSVLLITLFINGCVGSGSSANNLNKLGNSALHSNEGRPHPDHVTDDKIKDKDKKRQELYDKLKDHGTTNVNQRQEVDKVLNKLPLHLLDAHATEEGKIEFISSNWKDTLMKTHGIDPEAKFTDYDSSEFSDKTIVDHALAYPVRVNGEAKLLVRADNGINYSNSNDNRARLYYSAVKGLLALHNPKVDSSFIKILQDPENSDASRYLDHPSIQRILAADNLTNEEILSKYKEDIENGFAYLLAGYHNEKDAMRFLAPEITDYLDKFEDKSNERYVGSNIVGEKLTNRERLTIQSVHSLIANNVHDSPTAMYENLIFRDKINRGLIHELDDQISELINKKMKNIQSTTNINLEISQDEINSIMRNVFGENPALTTQQKDNTLNFITKKYMFQSISAKYYHIYTEMEPRSSHFGTLYASLLDAKLAVCDNFAILNYFMLKQRDEFKNDLMIPVRIGPGHTVPALEHNDQIYIVDSWIAFLHADQKIKPYFGELDSYLTYIDQNFAGEDKSTWYKHGQSEEVKNGIKLYINQAKNDKKDILFFFAGKGIDLENQIQINIINDYIKTIKK